jgi:hypothetical protein
VPLLQSQCLFSSLFSSNPKLTTKTTTMTTTTKMQGGFGGKETLSTYTAARLAVAAKKLNRPVKILLDRDEVCNVFPFRTFFSPLLSGERESGGDGETVGHGGCLFRFRFFSSLFWMPFSPQEVNSSCCFFLSKIV